MFKALRERDAWKSNAIFCALFMHAPKLRRTFFISCTFILLQMLNHICQMHTQSDPDCQNLCIFHSMERPKEETWQNINTTATTTKWKTKWYHTQYEICFSQICHRSDFFDELHSNALSVWMVWRVYHEIIIQRYLHSSTNKPARKRSIPEKGANENENENRSSILPMAFVHFAASRFTESKEEHHFYIKQPKRGAACVLRR